MIMSGDCSLDNLAVTHAISIGSEDLDYSANDYAFEVWSGTDQLMHIETSSGNVTIGCNTSDVVINGYTTVNQLKMTSAQYGTSAPTRTLAVGELYFVYE